MTDAINVNASASRIDEVHYVIAEDWPTVELTHEAAAAAAAMLKPKSGYAGSRNLDNVADFIAGLLNCREKRRYYGCSILVVSVLEDKATDF